MIKIEPVCAFSDNYIWCLYDTDSRQAVVVDPGDATPVIAVLNSKQLTLAAIIITHHHFDHTGGIDSLLALSPVPVYGPQNKNITQISCRLAQTDSLSVLGLDFTVLEIPGHTLDHIALYCADVGGEPVLFCGDTLFAGGCGRIFEGNPAMMLNSLLKLSALPANTRVYCAHEYTLANLAFAETVEANNSQLQQRIEHDFQLREAGLPTLPSTIATELATNPFLRCTKTSVIASAKLQSTNQCTSPVDVFTAIRAWKDNF